jgi:hypothetical protein
MNINTRGKQQHLADRLAWFKDAYIVGILNDYEMAGKILRMLEQMEADEISEEEKPQTESEAFRLAH